MKNGEDVKRNKSRNTQNNKPQTEAAGAHPYYAYPSKI